MQLSLVAAFLCRDDHGCVLLSKGWALSRLYVPLVELMQLGVGMPRVGVMNYMAGIRLELLWGG